MPEISVIVPVYKAENFLRKCAGSILGQSFSDLELLLVEDGSPDGSGPLCDDIAEEDARVRVFHKENGGVSSARNLGMEQAQGRFLAFADADDWLPPDALEALYRAAVDNEADCAGGAHYRAEVDGRLDVERGALPAGVYGPEAIRTGIVHRLLGERIGPPDTLLNGFIWRFLFDRATVMEHGLRFDGAYLEDELFLMEFFCLSKRLAMVDAPVYYYLQNPQSVTRRYLPDYMDTFTRFMERKEQLARRFGLEEAVPLWRESSNWSGLLIAVGNEFASGNTASLAEKRESVRTLCARPEMREAIARIRPDNLGRNKQVVANLLCRGRFFSLSLLYAIKNRRR